MNQSQLNISMMNDVGMISDDTHFMLIIRGKMMPQFEINTLNLVMFTELAKRKFDMDRINLKEIYEVAKKRAERIDKGLEKL